MRSRAILTAAAATAATLGGVLASAGTAAAATTAPPAAPVPPTAPQAAPTPGILAVENALEFADNWCVAPMRFTGSLIANPFPTVSTACGHHRTGSGFRLLSNMCIAPITVDDPTGPGPAPSTACRNDGDAGPGFEIARNVSVAGVQATY